MIQTLTVSCGTCGEQTMSDTKSAITAARSKRGSRNTFSTEAPPHARSCGQSSSKPKRRPGKGRPAPGLNWNRAAQVHTLTAVPAGCVRTER